jgi:hypothetical protein
VLAPNGSRRFTLTAPDRVVSLSAHSAAMRRCSRAATC